MEIRLPEDVERSIHTEIQSGHFASVDDAIAVAWRVYLEQRREPSSPGEPTVRQEPTDQPIKPVWERILELTADVPEEEWARLPTDLAEQHDHYIYGTPKRPTT